MTPKGIYTGEYVAFSPFDREALRTLIRSIDQPFKRIVEIGSWMGNGSTQVFIEELQGAGGLLYCVDHWQGNANVARHQQLVSHYNILDTFRTNVESFGGAELVKPLVMSSLEAAAILRDGFFDLVFIDGDHSYDQTASDIDVWRPKVASGGILSGHDCETRADEYDKDFLWENRNCDVVPVGGNFPVIHPGVVLAVGEKFGGKARLWSKSIETLADGSTGRSSIWDLVV